MQVLTESAKSLIKTDNKVKGEYMKVFNVGERTVLNWIEDDNTNLVTVMSLNIIKNMLGLNAEEVLTEKVLA